jgi:hypothetical protein
MIRNHNNNQHNHSPEKTLAKPFIGLLKGSTKIGVSTALTAKKFKTSATSERAKSHLCILTLGLDNSGPVEFVGR